MKKGKGKGKIHIQGKFTKRPTSAKKTNSILTRPISANKSLNQDLINKRVQPYQASYQVKPSEFIF